MSSPGAGRRQQGSSRVWLHSAPADLAVLLVPLAAVMVFVAIAAWRGDGAGAVQRTYAGWVSQYVLLNTSHVLLTFLLLFVQRDVLAAAPGQPRLVVGGGLVAFALAFAMFWATQVPFPMWADFGYAVAYLFATHHRLSQTKGVWSLYNLVGSRAGATPPGPRELRLQKAMVPVGLVLVSVRVLFVPATSSALFPVTQAVPGMPAILPHATVWALIGAWTVLLVLIAHAMSGSFRTSGKAVYVLLYTGYFGVLIYSPIWGSALIGGVHGLEYLLLTNRMLRKDGENAWSPRRAATLFVAMVPSLMVGLYTAPFSVRFPAVSAVVLQYAQLVLASVVMAHYFTDAVIYRFRIPTVRATMLRRLHLAT